MATNGATNGAATPDIILYTNHGCPWAQRAHIALEELGIPFKEEIIDLDRPRDPWYLKVNPVCSFAYPLTISHGSCSNRRLNVLVPGIDISV